MGTDQANHELKLRFSAGRFEEPLIGLILLAQATLGAVAIIAFLWWANLVLGSVDYSGMLKFGVFWEYFNFEWFPRVLTLASVLAIPVILLEFLYEDE